VSPRCDTSGSPVVKAARAALGRGNVTLILPYLPRSAEAELRRAFERAVRVRLLSPEAREAIDAWFVETAVRLHRQGPGARCAGPGGVAVEGVLLAL
jgi:hypothetical protein